MILRNPLFVLMLVFSFGASLVYSQNRVRTVIIQTEPDAIVWIDNVKRGVTDENGKLEIKSVKSGTRKLRVRAMGFKQVSKNLLPRQRGVVKVPLVKTNDAAELAFQEGEKLLAEDKEKAIEQYQKAVRLKPRYAEAWVALARALTGIDNEEALAAIAKARRARPRYAEASAAEARIHRSDNDIDKAVESFDRAIREGRGFQPEAHTGLGLIFKDDATTAASSGDTDEEQYNYGEAAKSFEKAIDQLSGTEPVLYILLGDVYEKMGNKQKAIAVYRRFLRDFPDHEERTAVESFIVQLNRTTALDQ
ncbi:MAG: tetratricopeptide repeat protein [Pyrinomonadaceae bacterium]|nr:tetratricopeptide repeat protein [Pyrinomonadaceae bacterium]